MAGSDDIKDEGEASPSGGDESALPPSAFAARVAREKPIIEGRAEDIPREPSGDNNAETNITTDAPFDDSDIPLPAGTHVPPPETDDESSVASPQPETEGIITPAAVPPPRRGGFVWPLALTIVVGAGLAVGGAWGLHQLDDTSTKIAALEDRLAAVEQKQDMASVLGASLPELKKRVSTLEGQNQSAQSNAAGLRADLNRLAAARTNPSAAGAAGQAPDLAPLEARVTALEQKFGALDTQFGGLASKIDVQKSQVRATEDRAIQSQAARADNEAVAIIAASLLRKVESGAPFAAELSALANRGVDKAKFAALEPVATSGIPTAAALSKQFSGVSDTILANEPAPKEHGFLDHLVRGAEKLVRIEKIGDTSGRDLASQVARIQGSLDAGAVETAYQEWAGLPAAAKAKSQAFGEAAKRRVDAIAAVRAIDADAMTALGKPKS